MCLLASTNRHGNLWLERKLLHITNKYTSMGISPIKFCEVGPGVSDGNLCMREHRCIHKWSSVSDTHLNWLKVCWATLSYLSSYIYTIDTADRWVRFKHLEMLDIKFRYIKHRNRWRYDVITMTHLLVHAWIQCVSTKKAYQRKRMTHYIHLESNWIHSKWSTL